MLPVLLLPQPPTRPSPASAIFYHFSLSCLQVNQNYPDCQDKDGMCESWAGNGECEVGALHCQDFSKLVRLGGTLGLASRWRAAANGRWVHEAFPFDWVPRWPRWQRWPRAVAVATGRHAGSTCGSVCLWLADCLLPA